MASQWERLLKNRGTWIGSFTRLSPQGAVLQDIPTVVALKPQNGDKAMRQEIVKSPSGEPVQERVLEYDSLARNLIFFENGAFSQGSLQWGPFSTFGAELGLISRPHRLRLVQLFDNKRQLNQLTLIREHLEEKEPSQRPVLTVDQLEGVWQGEAVTLYPDLRPSDTYSTRLAVTRDGNTVQQILHIGDGNTIPPIRSEGNIQGDRIVFESGAQTVQVLLLPDGSSSTCPTHVEPRQPFFLEVGWLVAPNLRQRMIRQYAAQGHWVNLTLVTESKVG
ncbi:MAG: DUF3598 family protein [Leptolyngbya sp. SIO1D8]|nr:DUF3598 family protein [Leptolyngbya sp. SIO1D8]